MLSIIISSHAMFWDFGHPKNVVSRSILYPEKKVSVSPKSLCISKKVFLCPKKKWHPFDRGVGDITLKSAFTSTSHACPNAATTDGAVLVKARVDKERKFAELVHGDSCRLVVVGNWRPLE